MPEAEQERTESLEDQLPDRAGFNVDAVSPLDGRYRRLTAELRPYTSERALMRYRAEVEAEYFLALHEEPELGLPQLDVDTVQELRAVISIGVADAHDIKDIEVHSYKELKATDHDVKAVEYFLRDRLADQLSPEQLEFIHFGLTSEDVNNLAVAMMLRDGVNEVLLPELGDIQDAVDELALTYDVSEMLSRTHGQPATPTTFGKEMRVFTERLERQLGILKDQRLQVKLNGATGNYNAHVLAFPNFDWPSFTKRFIASLDKGGPIRIEPNLITTQIEPGDSYIELFHTLQRLNTVLIDFSQDMWWDPLESTCRHASLSIL